MALGSRLGYDSILVDSHMAYDFSKWSAAYIN